MAHCLLFEKLRRLFDDDSNIYDLVRILTNEKNDCQGFAKIIR